MTDEQLALDVRTPSGRKSRANTGMSETQLLAAVRKLAHYRGWMTYHTHWSRGSEAGWPDLVLVNRRHRRVVLAELKANDGQLTAAQVEWLTALDACGLEVTVWRPADLRDVIPAVLAGKLRAGLVEDPHARLVRDRVRARRSGESTAATAPNEGVSDNADRDNNGADSGFQAMTAAFSADLSNRPYMPPWTERGGAADGAP